MLVKLQNTIAKRPKNHINTGKTRTLTVIRMPTAYEQMFLFVWYVSLIL